MIFAILFGISFSIASIIIYVYLKFNNKLEEVSK